MCDKIKRVSEQEQLVSLLKTNQKFHTDIVYNPSHKPKLPIEKNSNLHSCSNKNSVETNLKLHQEPVSYATAASRNERNNLNQNLHKSSKNNTGTISKILPQKQTITSEQVKTAVSEAKKSTFFVTGSNKLSQKIKTVAK
ncbi:hypothetical protein NQ314_004178 [Rhamnusium bicolor]|uniref:Uncharacterized protein n=1 Tax=Rhamnusium bicolor TaxID=1586634 RepID=A0AAV8ZLX9_9CUCU|nr:hypothetical protein NQ314_004178 [Rhamnusium bicolor]